MTRLAVMADPHCDDFGSKIDPETRMNARWVDTVAMVRWVAEDAKAREANVLIVAGDLTEQKRPEVATWRVDMIGEALEAFGGPVKLLRGNHDGLLHRRSIVDVLARGRPGWDGFSVPGITLVGDVAIAMLPYLDSAWKRAQPRWETKPDVEIYAALKDDFLTIARGLFVAASGVASRTVLIVHQALSGGNMSDSQRAFLGDQALVVDTGALAAIGYDAILAGHFHLHQVLSTDPLIAYAGAPYRTDFGEEHQAKGYLIVNLGTGPAAGVPATMQFVETPARRFVTIRDQLGDLINADVAGAVVRVVDVDPAVDVAEIQRALEAVGAFDVQEIRTRAVDTPEVVGGIDETLSPEATLEEYFADDPDRDELVKLGRELLEAVR